MFVLYGNVYMVNIDQNVMYEGRNATETFVQSVITKLQEKQLYSLDKSFIFIGRPSDNLMFRTTESWDMANNYARYGYFALCADCFRMSYNGVLRDIGVNLTYCVDDVYAKLCEREDVKNMQIFPAEGSIREIDGNIVIKIADI